MTPEQHALSQMRITNMIKDSDYMEYIIPVDGTKFIINRYDTKYSSIGTED